MGQIIQAEIKQAQADYREKYVFGNQIMLVLWQEGKTDVDNISKILNADRNDVVGELEKLQSKGFVAQVDLTINNNGSLVPQFQLLVHGENIIKRHINTISIGAASGN